EPVGRAVQRTVPAPAPIPVKTCACLGTRLQCGAPSAATSGANPSEGRPFAHTPPFLERPALVTTPILPTLEGPADLRSLTEPELAQLADEVREAIIATVATTGGPL